MDGLSVADWLSLWLHSVANVQGSLVRLAWPDGKSLLEQPALAVEMFALITDEARKEQEAERQRAGP